MGILCFASGPLIYKNVDRGMDRPAVLGRPPHGLLPPLLLEAEEKSGQQRGRLEGGGANCRGARGVIVNALWE